MVYIGVEYRILQAWWIFILVGASPGWTRAEAPNDKDCKRSYTRKAYAEAARCFERGVHPRHQTLSPSQRIVSGRRLRNAAFCYGKAADIAQEEKAAYYRERAAELLNRYLKQKFFEGRHRKTSAIVMLHALKEKLIYTPLTVLSQHPHAEISVHGYQFARRRIGRWSEIVRPGLYKIQVLYPGHPTPQTKTHRVHPKKPTVLRFQPPHPKKPATAHIPLPQKTARVAMKPIAQPPQKTISPWAWILLGVGGATLISSGISLFAMLDARAQAQISYIKAKSESGTPEDTKAMQAFEKHSENTATASIILVSIGGAMLFGGGLLLFFPQSPNPPSLPKSQPQNTTKRKMQLHPMFLIPQRSEDGGH